MSRSGAFRPLCLLLLLPTACAMAQERSFVVRHLTVAEGLSQNTVHTILQDRQGFLWFGTQDGLNRYDGYEFTVYRPDSDPQGAPESGWVRALHEDQQGFIWIATDAGLARLDPNSGSFESVNPARVDEAGSCGRDVYDVTVSEDVAWVAEAEGGLCVLRLLPANESPKAAAASVLSAVSPYRVQTLLTGRSGSVWIGTDGGGLFRFRPADGTLRHYVNRPGSSAALSSNAIYALHQCERGLLWIGTATGLDVLDPATGRVSRFTPQTEPFGPVLGIVTDGPERVWVGSNGGGLFLFNPETGAFARATARGSNDPEALRYVLSLTRDASGLLWIGTGGFGVAKLLPRSAAFHHLSRDDGLASEIVRTFAVDSTGSLWAGTSDGFTRIELSDERAQTVTRRVQGPLVCRRYVRALARGDRGRLFAGTYDGGLCEFDPVTGRLEQLPLFEEDYVQAVFSLYRGETGILWIGTQTGLLSYEPPTGAAARVELPDDAAGAPVRALYEDVGGSLWVGTGGAGLFRIEPTRNRISSFRHSAEDPSSLSSNHVYAITADATGRLWVGTRNGLNHMQASGRSFDRYGEAEGLPSTVINGIVPHETHVWVSTNRGIARIDVDSGRAASFGVIDGVEVVEFNVGASFVGGDGRIFFGGVDGIVWFDPAAVTTSDTPPPVVLTGIAVDGQDTNIPAAEAARLEAGTSTVSFAFAALDFTAPEQNRYAYRLAGVDPDWIYAGSRRTVTYADLDPGRYTFSVRAANSDGIWNEQGASLRLVVEPQAWQTWWFYVASVLFAAGLLFSAHRLRVMRVLEVEQARTRIADDLHDSIGSQLSSLALRLELASRSEGIEEVARPYLSQAAEDLRGAVGDLRDAVWVVDAGHDTLPDLAARLEEVARQALSGRQSDVRVEQNLPPLVLPLHMRRNVLLIFREALNNALRHAGASRVEVRIDLEDDALSIVVEDDGAGFERSVVPCGRGLRTMRMRAEEVGGRLDVSSRTGSGTRVSLRAPLRRKE